MTPPLTSEQKSHNTELLLQACQKGRLNEVKRFLPVSDPTSYSKALRWAAQEGHVDIVQLLLPVSNPKARNSCALRWAAELGHTECVKLLLPFSNPKDLDSQALLNAAEGGFIDIVRLLIPVSDCNSALNVLQSEGNDITLLQQCMNEYEVMQQKKRLNTALSETVDTKKNSIKRKL